MNRLLLIGTLAMAGFLATLGSAVAPFGDAAACLPLGSVPACALVLGGYAAMFSSTLFTGWRASAVFLSGWIIALSLSVAGALTGALGGPPAVALFLTSFFSTITVAALGVTWVRPYLCQPIWSR